MQFYFTVFANMYSLPCFTIYDLKNLKITIQVTSDGDCTIHGYVLNYVNYIVCAKTDYVFIITWLT